MTDHPTAPVQDDDAEAELVERINATPNLPVQDDDVAKLARICREHLQAGNIDDAVTAFQAYRTPLPNTRDRPATRGRSGFAVGLPAFGLSR
jgi:hypothetical protein